MPASGYLGSFHADHIIARQHGGESGWENPALACLHCNQHKGPNIAGRNPETGEIVELFHPRRDWWGDHFDWNRADLNDPGFRAVRIALMDEGFHTWA